MVAVEKSLRLMEVSRGVVSAAAESPVHSILALFQDDPDLLAVVVTADGAFVGSITRKALFNLASRPFAVDLYAKKPLSTLLEDLRCKKVVLEPGLEINEAAVQLLSLDPTLQTDAFPLVREGTCVGVVAVADLMMAVAEDQRRLLTALDRLSLRLREEVASAKKIQQDLLPLPQYAFQEVGVGAGITTSTEIGGDFFDYFAIDDHRLGLLIADVSGHGVQAGMVTTAAKASLHTLIALRITTPAALLCGMNRAILATARQTLFMTCLIATVDLAAGSITIANAGHNFPYLCSGRAELPQMVDAAVGFPLGFERDSEYREETIPFRPGDSFFMYTDGIVECTNEEGEELGYERLAELLAQHRELPPHELHQALLQKAAAFAGRETFDDDVTTLVAAYPPPKAQ